MEIQFIHSSGQNGIVSIGYNGAAVILGCSLITIKRMNESAKGCTDSRFKYLEAVVCRRIIPANWGIWFDEKTNALYNEAGDKIGRGELQALGWLRGAGIRAREELKRQKELAEELRSVIADLEQKLVKAEKRALENLTRREALWATMFEATG